MNDTKPTLRKPTADQRRCIQLVRQARKRGHMLEDLAQHLGTSFSTVSRWINGSNMPHRNTAARLVPLLEQLKNSR